MKIRETHKDNDLLCQGSMSFLTKRIKRLFKENYPDANTWFPDDSYSWEEPKNDTKILDIILYGNFLRDFLESGNWPVQNCRLWVLANSVKDFMVTVLKIPANNISVIPRELIQKTNTEVNRVPTNQYIYAGRLSRQKNIKDLLLTYYFLQNNDAGSTLNLYGNFDDVYHYDQGRFQFEHSFKTGAQSIIENLNWNNEPVFNENKTTEEWLNSINTNQTLLSFSSYYMEDFGVSIAEVQEANIPTIISDWGGHKDLQNKLSYRFSSQYLASQSSPLGLRVALAEEVAKLIKNKKFLKNKMNNDKLEQPHLISKEILDELRGVFISEVGVEIFNIPRDKTETFADSIKGKEVFNKYKKCFSSELETKEVLLIVGQVGTENEKENREIYSIAKELVSKNCTFRILDSVNILNKSGIKELMKATSVYYTSDLESFSQKAFTHIKSIAPGAVELEIKHVFPKDMEKLII